MKTKKIKTKISNEELIREALSKLLSVCYLINTETKYCVFCNFRGHTNEIQVHICKSKIDFNEYVSNLKVIYLDEEGTFDEIVDLVAKLSIFLMENKGKKNDFINL